MSKGYTNYNKLSKEGALGELAFLDYLHGQGFTNIQHIDDVYEKEGLDRNAWDLRATNDVGLTMTFEIKTQNKCDQFGYFNVEQVQNGLPAGIATSKADIWVFYNINLGFGIIEASELKKIHWNICKDPTVSKQSYHDKMKRGELILWITKYKNFACGWRMPNDRLTWHKH